MYICIYAYTGCVKINAAILKADNLNNCYLTSVVEVPY